MSTLTAPPKLFAYLSRQFLFNFVILIGILLGIVYIFEVLELMRRTSGMAAVPLHLVLGLAALKLPHTGVEIIPFGVLFSAIYTCWKLNRTQELIVIRAAGLSVWQFLNPLIVMAILLGLLTAMVLNPASAAMLSKYRRLQGHYFQKNQSFATVSSAGIWLRQPVEEGYALIHAGRLERSQDPSDKAVVFWRMANVIIYIFSPDDTFLRRIDAESVLLQRGFWRFGSVLISDEQGTRSDTMPDLPTDLTVRKIEDSFSDPDTIPFWKLNGHIQLMEETGLSSLRLLIHYHTLLAQPVFLAAMILLAATFSLRPPRFGGTGGLVALGVAAGAFIFFMESMLGAFGVSQKIPPAMAAWTPGLVTLFLGLAALLYFEDG